MSEKPGGPADFRVISLNLGLKVIKTGRNVFILLDTVSLGASGAKQRIQQNKRLVII